MKQQAHLKFVQNLALEALEKFPQTEPLPENCSDIDTFKNTFKKHSEIYRFYNSKLAEGPHWCMLQGHLGERSTKIAELMLQLNHMLLEAHETVEYSETGPTKIRELYVKVYPESLRNPEEPVRIALRLSDLAKYIFLEPGAISKTNSDPNLVALHLEVYKTQVTRAHADLFYALSLIAHYGPDIWETSGMSAFCPECPGKPKKR